MRVKVIGIGTRNGDDAAGLDVVAALAARPLPLPVGLVCVERPLPDLLDACADADVAVVVDAARGVAPPGCARRVAREELARAAATSSHGFGVARALALAEALGSAPPRIELVATEGGGDAAVDAGVRLVLDLLASLERSGG